MIIALGSDHAGYNLKEEIKEYLKSKDIIVNDLGTHSLESVDYPDYALKVAEEVTDNRANFGILVCYTGIGMSIAANKVKGIRAALVSNVESAQLTRQHNNANILCLGAKDTSFALAKEIVDAFLNNDFLGERHERRVNKIISIENKYGK